MAKTVQTEALALDALAGLLGDASPRVLFGSKAAAGVFKGATAAFKAAGQLCLENGWLEPTGSYSGKGKSRKELYRVTAVGLQAVLSRSDPAGLLRGLGERLQQLGERSADLPRLIQEKLAEISSQVAAQQGSIQKTIEDLRLTISRTAERLKPPDLEELRRVLAQPGPTVQPAAPAADGWLDEVVRLAAEQKQRNPFQRLTLPQIYDQVRSRFPNLTLGQYHDGLRRLQGERRIRLGPFTQALATLDDPRNALYLDREVKYYVEPA